MRDFYNPNLKRWWVYTNAGRKISWSVSPEEASLRAKEKGLTVAKVRPAPPPQMP